MIFKELFPLIENEPFVIYQYVSDKESGLGSWVQTRNCISVNQNLDKQMDEQIFRLSLITLKGNPVIHLTLSNSNN